MIANFEMLQNSNLLNISKQISDSLKYTLGISETQYYKHIFHFDYNYNSWVSWINGELSLALDPTVDKVSQEASDVKLLRRSPPPKVK